MSDILSDDGDNMVKTTGRVSRPTLAQVEALIAFMEKNPDLASGKHRNTMRPAKYKKLWVELSRIANSINGAVKTTKGWIKFWADKKRHIELKKRQIARGNCGISQKLTPLEQKILNISGDKPASTRKKKAVKREPCNGDDDDFDSYLSNNDDFNDLNNDRLQTNEDDERQLNMIEKMIEVMDQQSAALTQMAQASLVNSKALERIAESAHIQALAAERLGGTFQSISASVHDVKKAIVSIDNTFKKYYTPTNTEAKLEFIHLGQV